MRRCPTVPFRDLYKRYRVRRVLARALEFTILTAARTRETIGAQWVEIDLDQRLWTVPAVRMKAGKEHRVPLSERAVALLEAAKALQTRQGNEFVCPGAKRAKPLSNMAMTAVLRRIGHGNITVHGFRSTFRDWAAEPTDFPGEVVEMALAHAVGDKVCAAQGAGSQRRQGDRRRSAWSMEDNHLRGRLAPQ